MATIALPSPSLEEVLPSWLEELQANDFAQGTKSTVEGFFAWYKCYEQRPLTFSTLTPIAPVGYRNYVQRTQRQATSTVKGQISALRAFCSWLTEERYLEINPAKHFKLVDRQDASSCEGLDEKETKALLCQARTSRDPLRNYAIVQMFLQTGIRLDECSQPTLDDIKLDERSGHVTIRQGKSNKARVVPLNASARSALAEYVASRLNCEPTVKAMARSWPHRSSGDSSIPLWQSQKKGCLATSAMRQMIDVLVRDTAGRGLVLAQTSAHTLRHTFARNYLAEGSSDIVRLASLLGHTSLDTTRIYSQPTIEQPSRRIEQLTQNAYMS